MTGAGFHVRLRDFEMVKRIALFVLLGCIAGVAQEPAKQEAARPYAVTLPEIEKRLEELKAAQVQAVANVQALGGAIQDCEFWIERFKQEAVKGIKEPEKQATGITTEDGTPCVSDGQGGLECIKDGGEKKEGKKK
jgi:hypothetical protein